MPFGVGPLEIGIVLLVVLVLFGPKRLPDLGRSLGKGLHEFKESVTGKDDDRDDLPKPAEATPRVESAPRAEPAPREQKP